MKAFAIFVLGSVLAVPAAFATPANPGGGRLQSSVQHVLRGSRFKNVHVAVQNGTATLTGTVNIFSDKLVAEKKAKHVHGVKAVQDEIQVAGPTVPDKVLQQRVGQAITNGLIGNVPVQFQSVGVEAHNGTVVLGGFVAGPIALNYTLGIAENVKGVKNLINRIQVDPVSPMDEGIRWREYRAVYSTPFLNYAYLNPQKPIRIQVENGHVTLYGVVDNQTQKTTVGIRAKSVPDVFSVKNDIIVANQSKENPGK